MKMQYDMTFDELVSAKTYDICDYREIMDKHKEEVETKAEELAKEKAEELFNAQKEEYRLEVIKEINIAAVTAKRAEISRSSPYISENVTVNGKELHGCDFIPDTAIHDPLYDDVQLIYNDYSHEWQILQKNGKRKFVSNFVVLAIVIVNATGIGQCKAIAVYLQGVDKPLIFKEGDISPSALKKQTQFFKKGTTITDKAFCESFVRAMKICCNIFFLTIPEHSGGNFLQEGVYNYTSALSVIPGLEELYADEIKQHQLIQHERKFEEVIAEHSTLFANCWKVKLAISVRVMSLLLPFYEAEGLKPDRFFVFSTNSDNEKKTLTALTSRFNYTLPVVTSVSSRINKVREALATGNDVTVIFTFFTGIDETRAFENALREIYMNITNENVFTASTRKIIEMITDFPGSIPEEYPAYYLSFAESAENVDVRTIQKMSGELDYSLIQFLTNNLDFAKKFIKAVVLETKKLLAHYMKSEHIELMTMLIATSILLKHLKIVSETEFQEIFDWSRKEANSRMTATEDICHKFQVAVCQSILSKELKIARQFEPPYYSNDGYTAFIAKADGSINFDEDVLNRETFSEISRKF